MRSYVFDMDLSCLGDVLVGHGLHMFWRRLGDDWICFGIVVGTLCSQCVHVLDVYFSSMRRECLGHALGMCRDRIPV